jgi:hypothetical protein
VVNRSLQYQHRAECIDVEDFIGSFKIEVGHLLVDHQPGIANYDVQRLAALSNAVPLLPIGKQRLRQKVRSALKTSPL